MLAFVKSKSPARGGERGQLCPRWVPPVPARAPPPASHAKAKSQRGYKALPPNTNTPGRARVSEKEDTSPPLSLSSSLPSVVSVSVSSLVAGDEKYTTQSAGVPKPFINTPNRRVRWCLLVQVALVYYLASNFCLNLSWATRCVLIPHCFVLINTHHTHTRYLCSLGFVNSRQW